MDNLSEDLTNHIEENTTEDLLYLEDTTTQPSTRSPRRINYERIRAQYIIGKRVLHEDGTVSCDNYTLQELCRLHNVFYPSVKARSAKEKWSIQRAAYKARLQENAEATALNIYLHEGAIADTQAMIATNKLNKIYKMALSRYDSVVEAYDSDRALDDDEAIDVKELKDLLAIGKDLHTLSQQVVRSRSQQIDPGLTKDLKQYAQRRLPTQKAHTNPETIANKIAHLQNILAPAIPTHDTTN